MERSNLKKLNEVKDKEQYHVEISNRFAALENLDTVVDINSAWETIRENIVTCGLKATTFASAGLSFAGRLLLVTRNTQLLWLLMALVETYPF
jgi:hypothetical protein